MESTPSTATHTEPWNKGKLIGQKHPLKLKEIWAIRIWLQLAKRARERFPQARVDGVLVQRMQSGLAEVIVG